MKIKLILAFFLLASVAQGQSIEGVENIDYDLAESQDNKDLDIAQSIREITEEEFDDIAESERYRLPDTSEGDQRYGTPARRPGCRPGFKPARLKVRTPVADSVAGPPLNHLIRGDRGETFYGGTYCIRY